mmetsp:Transcript_5304/g.8717  ORF Transcript_5304/g.8717 Transcript_5304/m.8717 type:complete len:399 (+) Transcript_5304:47-1243(+)
MKTVQRLLHISFVIAALCSVVVASNEDATSSSSSSSSSTSLTKIPSPATLGQIEECVKETIALEDKNGAVQNFNTNSSVASSTTSVVVGFPSLTTAVFMDFTNQTEAYEKDCTASGGVYRTFDLELSCTESDIAMRKINLKQFNVIGLPRCYGITCSADEEPGLLEEYTFRPTSEALSQQESDLNDTTWKCVGMIVDSLAIRESFCKTQGDSLEGNANVQAAYDSMVKATKDVVGESDAILGIPEYESVCETSGGILVKQPVALTCTKKREVIGIKTIRNKATFTASNFPMCIGSTCSKSVPDNAGYRFEQFLKDCGTLEEDTDFEWDCEQGAGDEDNANWFQNIKAKFQDNPDLFYSICGSAVISLILICACCFWSYGPSSNIKSKRPAEEDGDSIA